jgi:predicted GIY-YIG superfamily endonuclease
MNGWQDKDPCVYFMASKRDGVLYTGVTMREARIKKWRRA